MPFCPISYAQKMASARREAAERVYASMMALGQEWENWQCFALCLEPVISVSAMARFFY